MGESRSKKIYLASGNEHGLAWQLSVNALLKQPRWDGSFYLSKAKKLHKTIHLTSGVEEGWGWQLNLNVSAKGLEYGGGFSLADETRKHRAKIRAIDRYWAGRLFPRQWRKQFEIHHDWNRGEVCYFLTAKEHHAIEKSLPQR